MMAVPSLDHVTAVAGFPVLAQVMVSGTSDVLCILDIITGAVVGVCVNVLSLHGFLNTPIFTYISNFRF